jgi:hypothetical protein
MLPEDGPFDQASRRLQDLRQVKHDARPRRQLGDRLDMVDCGEKPLKRGCIRDDGAQEAAWLSDQEKAGRQCVQSFPVRVVQSTAAHLYEA